MSLDVASASAPNKSRSVAPPQAPSHDINRHPMVLVLAAVCWGIAVDRYLPTSLSLWCGVAVGALAMWFVVIRWRIGHPALAIGLLLMSAGAIAGTWHHLRWRYFAVDDIGLVARDESRPASLEVIALSSPRRLPAPSKNPLRIIPVGDRCRLDVAVVAVRNGNHWTPCQGRARMYVAGHLLGVSRGDRLHVFGNLSKPRPAHQSGQFDFREHARGDRILAQISVNFPDCVTVIDVASTATPARWLDEIRTQSSRLLARHIHARYAGLATAVLLGAREQLDREQTAAFVETGTVHLLAISGLHVGILASGLFFLLRLGWVPRRWALVTVATTVVLYALLTHSRPPVLRTAIMITLGCSALYMGRRPLAWNTLAIAALVVLAMNPAELFRAGAQLSFLAVATLMWGLPKLNSKEEIDPLDRLIQRARPWPQRAVLKFGRWITLLMLTSATIWLVSLPLVMARFHLAAPASILLFALFWLPMIVVLFSGFCVLIFGWLALPLGHWAGVVCNGSLAFLNDTVQWTRQLEGSHYWVAGPDNWWLLGCYGLLLLMILPGVRAVARRWRWAAMMIWIAVGLSVGWQRAQPSDRLDCTFLSVGHGCCVVLELPNGRTMVYDAGHSGSPSSGAQTIASFLWSRGITRIDDLIISHADADHYNAAPELLRRFDVTTIHVSPVMFNESSCALEALRTAIKQAGVPISLWTNSRRLRSGDVTIDIMHPSAAGVDDSDNANSIVLAVEYRGKRLLLPGDLEGRGLRQLITQSPYDCDVLLAPHHGSPHSSPKKICRLEHARVDRDQRRLSRQHGRRPTDLCSERRQSPAYRRDRSRTCRD